MSVFNLEFDGFWRDENSSGVPKVTGIYAVYRCVHNIRAGTVTLNEILYIGESENVGDRIAGHDRRDDWERKLRSGEQLCFAVAGYSGKERVRVEAALIRKHQPTLNVEYKDSFPFPQTRVISTGKTGVLLTDFIIGSAQSSYRTW